YGVSTVATSMAQRNGPNWAPTGGSFKAGEKPDGFGLRPPSPSWLASGRAQMIQFFIQPTPTTPGSRLHGELQPLLSLFLLIDGRTGCPDSVRAIDRFDPNHYPLSVGRQCLVTADEFF